MKQSTAPQINLPFPISEPWFKLHIESLVILSQASYMIPIPPRFDNGAYQALCLTHAFWRVRLASYPADSDTQVASLWKVSGFRPQRAIMMLKSGNADICAPAATLQNRRRSSTGRGRSTAWQLSSSPLGACLRPEGMCGSCWDLGFSVALCRAVGFDLDIPVM